MLHDFEFTVCCEGGMHVHTCTVDTLEVTCNLLATSTLCLAKIRPLWAGLSRPLVQSATVASAMGQTLHSLPP